MIVINFTELYTKLNIVKRENSFNETLLEYFGFNVKVDPR